MCIAKYLYSIQFNCTCIHTYTLHLCYFLLMSIELLDTCLVLSTNRPFFPTPIQPKTAVTNTPGQLLCQVYGSQSLYSMVLCLAGS